MAGKVKAAGKGPVKKSTSLARALGALQQTKAKAIFEEAFVSTDENKIMQSLPHLPTGSIIVDYLIGGRPNRHGVMPCPGFPKGKVVNLYGQEAAGKTTLALTVAANAAAAGLATGYIDWEHSLVLSYARALGVPEDEDLFRLVQPVSLEAGLCILLAMARTGVDLIVVDSVGAGVPEAALREELQDKGGMGRVGLLAGIWSRFLPELKSPIARSGSCVVGISQLRSKISTGGPKGKSQGPTTTHQGGEAWKYYSEVRLGLRKVKVEKAMVYNPILNKKEEAAVNTVVRAKIDKCKVAASQGREADYYLVFGEGIDDMRSIVEIGARHGVVKKTGGWIAWERASGEVLKSQGIGEFKKLLKEQDGAWSELYDRILSVMSSAVVAGAGALVPEGEEEDLEDLSTFIAASTTEEAEPKGDDEE